MMNVIQQSEPNKYCDTKGVKGSGSVIMVVIIMTCRETLILLCDMEDPVIRETAEQHNVFFTNVNL